MHFCFDAASTVMVRQTCSRPNEANVGAAPTDASNPARAVVIANQREPFPNVFEITIFTIFRFLSMAANDRVPDMRNGGSRLRFQIYNTG